MTKHLAAIPTLNFIADPRCADAERIADGLRDCVENGVDPYVRLGLRKACEVKRIKRDCQIHAAAAELDAADTRLKAEVKKRPGRAQSDIDRRVHLLRMRIIEFNKLRWPSWRKRGEPLPNAEQVDIHLFHAASLCRLPTTRQALKVILKR